MDIYTSNMQALIWDDSIKRGLQNLREYVERHPLTMDDLLDAINGGPAPGDRDEFICTIPVGVRVVYTIEPLHTGQLIRHLSVSVMGKLPSITIVTTIMEELGFKNTLYGPGCQVKMDEPAVHIIESYE